MKFVNGVTLLVAIALLYMGYTTGNYAPFIALFITGAVLNAPKTSGQLAVSVYPCELGAPTTASAGCSTRGGMNVGYWAKYSDIDWVAMATGQTPQFNSTTKQISGFTMIGNTFFTKVEHDKKLGSYEAIYTEADGFYKNSLKLFFIGKSNANREVFSHAISCCDIVYITIGNDGTIRIFGADFNGTSITQLLTPLKIARHGDYGGQLGQSDKARDEVDLEGESLNAPFFGTFAESAIPVD